MLRKLRCGLVFAWLTAAALSGTADQSQAQADTAATDAASDRAQSFQAVTGAVKEDIAGAPLMLAAYAVVWVAVFGYVYRLVRLQRGVEADVARLERTLDSVAAQRKA